MQRALSSLALLAAVLVLSAACSDDGGADAADVEGAWVLSSGNHDGDSIPLVDGYRITLTIENESIGGTSACNLYGADAEIEDGALRLAELISTARGCEPAVMTSEQAYLAALTAVDAIARDGDALVLSGPRTELRFEELPPVPTADLLGTVWVLDTLIEDDTATTVAGDPATLELRDNGSLVGSTGCRTLSGEYVVSGDEVIATSFGAQGECPSDLAAQDSHIVTVIGDGFTVAIDGDRLTLSSQGGLGASYRAR